MELQGKRIAIVMDTGFHEHEFFFPYYRFQEAGAEVIVAGPEAGATLYGEGRHGMDGLPFETTAAIRDLRADDLDAVHLPGGIYGPLALRINEPALRLVRDMVARNRIVGAICHGPWVLVTAGVVKGRRVACPDDMAADVINAGATYVPEGAVQDGPLVTGVYFGILPEYMRVFLAAVAAK
jgi:PfpI family intracellular protease